MLKGFLGGHLCYQLSVLIGATQFTIKLDTEEYINNIVFHVFLEIHGNFFKVQKLKRFRFFLLRSCKVLEFGFFISFIGALQI